MQTDQRQDQGWVGPDLPSLSGVVFGSIRTVAVRSIADIAPRTVSDVLSPPAPGRLPIAC